MNARRSSRPRVGHGRWKHTWQAGRLLLRAIGSRPPTEVSVPRRTTNNGTEYDLYEPSSAPRGTFILLYGMNMAGPRETRLVQLARAFAGSGFRVAIPCLAGLQALSFDRDDKRAITDLVIQLHEEYGGRIGITGVSAGAGIALTVAADPAVANLIDPLLLFGPYYSLADLSTAWQAYDTPASNDGKDWDCYIWAQMVTAFRNRDSLGLSPTEERELVDLLRDYCDAVPLRQKRDFHRRVLQSRNLHGRMDTPPDRRTLEELSPQGQLHGLGSRVLILHDSTDRLISPDHSRRIVDELDRHGRSDAAKLVITPLISHASLGSLWRIRDIFRVLRLVGEIFAD